MLAQTTHQSKCQQIIRAKNSCRFALNAEELLGTLFTITGSLSGSGDIYNHLVGIKANSSHSLHHTSSSFCALPNTEGAMHKANAFMALFKQVSRGKFPPSYIIDSDRAEVLRSARTVQ